MTESDAQLHFSEIKGVLRRFLLVRDRLRVGLPENMAVLKQRLRQSKQGKKAEAITNFDHFYNICGIFDEHEGPLTMGELGQQLGVPLSTATRMVDWLVKNGYAERLADPQDRRVVRVALTEAGTNIYHEIDQFSIEHIQRLFSQFTPEETAAFLRLLDKIVATIEKQS